MTDPSGDIRTAGHVDDAHAAKHCGPQKLIQVFAFCICSSRLVLVGKMENHTHADACANVW